MKKSLRAKSQTQACRAFSCGPGCISATFMFIAMHNLSRYIPFANLQHNALIHVLLQDYLATQDAACIAAAYMSVVDRHIGECQKLLMVKTAATHLLCLPHTHLSS